MNTGSWLLPFHISSVKEGCCWYVSIAMCRCTCPRLIVQFLIPLSLSSFWYNFLCPFSDITFFVQFLTQLSLSSFWYNCLCPVFDTAVFVQFLIQLSLSIFQCKFICLVSDTAFCVQFLIKHSLFVQFLIKLSLSSFWYNFVCPVSDTLQLSLSTLWFLCPLSDTFFVHFLIQLSLSNFWYNFLCPISGTTFFVLFLMQLSLSNFLYNFFYRHLDCLCPSSSLAWEMLNLMVGCGFSHYLPSWHVVLVCGWLSVNSASVVWEMLNLMIGVVLLWFISAVISASLQHSAQVLSYAVIQWERNYLMHEFEFITLTGSLCYSSHVCTRVWNVDFTNNCTHIPNQSH